MDYASDEYASVDSYEKGDKDQTDHKEEHDGTTSDTQADMLLNTFCPQSLVDVAVTSELDNIINKAHLSPRNRGRGRASNIGGRQTSRGMGGRHSNQQPVGSSQGKNLYA